MWKCVNSRQKQVHKRQDNNSICLEIRFWFSSSFYSSLVVVVRDIDDVNCVVIWIFFIFFPFYMAWKKNTSMSNEWGTLSFKVWTRIKSKIIVKINQGNKSTTRNNNVTCSSEREKKKLTTDWLHTHEKCHKLPQEIIVFFSSSIFVHNRLK